METIEIRNAVPADIPHVHSLMGEFAEFENLQQYFSVTPDGLHDVIFGEDGFASCLVAHRAEIVVGYALFYPCYASFSGERGLFLEDLYISPDMRGLGLGRRMLERLAHAARERGFSRIAFQVLDWNEKAIRFYKGLGARVNEEDRHFVFDDEAFAKLAENA